MKKKVFSLLLLASLTTMAFTGCAVKLPFGIEFTLGGNEKPDQEVSNTQPEIIVDNSETETDYDYDYGNNGNDVPEDKPEDESDNNVQTPGTSQVATGSITGPWTNMEFLLDGNYLQLPTSYQNLVDLGWTFDLADYGYENGYIMNQDDKTYATIELENPLYSDDLKVYVGFVNNGYSACDITQCDIWAIEIDTCYGFEQVDSFPSMEIANGIHFGSTEEDVIAAFGPCDDVYECEYYKTYEYCVDYTYYLNFTIYEEYGVTAIELEEY